MQNTYQKILPYQNAVIVLRDIAFGGWIISLIAIIAILSSSLAYINRVQLLEFAVGGVISGLVLRYTNQRIVIWNCFPELVYPGFVLRVILFVTISFGVLSGGSFVLIFQSL